jgi:hypothetical protein
MLLLIEEVFFLFFSDDNKVRLAKEEGYNALKQLSKSEIEYVKAEAIWTLAILAALPRNHRKIIKFIGWDDILNYASTNENREIGRATATLLGNLALYGKHTPSHSLTHTHTHTQNTH